jgi:GNAT superfamily N-acetyltransferase
MDTSELKVVEGLSDELIEQLINYSNNDDRVKEYTSDAKRFKNRTTYNKWREKKRAIYAMADVDDKLLGVSWFGEKLYPYMGGSRHLSTRKYPFTFAIRVYGRLRGKRMARWFMNEVFARFYKKLIYKKHVNKGFWVDVYKRNLPAIKLYKGFGFRKASSYDGKLIMVYDEKLEDEKAV